MYDVISPSEAKAAQHCWADGAAELGVDSLGGETRLKHLYQSDPCRILFPRPAKGGCFEAVVATTSGGIVGGDRVRIDLRADEGASVSVATQAAEKVYRSAGAESAITVRVEAATSATVEWMPQETILFDRSRLRRNTHLSATEGSRILAGESVVFGRRARGERFARGALHDAWRVVRDGRLIWADALHLSQDVGAIIARPSAFGDAAALATILYVADDAGDHLATARDMLAQTEGCAAGATLVGQVLIVRLMSTDAAALRATQSRFWSGFRAAVLNLPAKLPRVWET
jgi:urease accessory protein